MADNLFPEAVVSASSSKLGFAETSFGGDTVFVGLSIGGITTGAEGSRTFTALVAGAGAVDGGTQRVTLASDDPGVVSLAILDDWDESDRAKVNLIAGQAGITAGAGAVAANTPRVTHASDDPVTTAVQLIDDTVYAAGAAVGKGLLMHGETPAGETTTFNVRSAQTLTATDKGVVTRSILYGISNADAAPDRLLTGGDGVLLVAPQGTIPVSNTSLELLDDVVLTDDAAFTPATSKVAMVGFEYDDTAPDSVNEGDGGAARMSARREIYVQIRDAAGNERGLNVDASGNIAVTDASGSLTVDNNGTFSVQVDGNALTALQLIDDVVFADDAAFTLGTSKGVMMMGFAGTQSVDANDAAALACTTAGALHVSDAGGSLTVDNGGTFAVQVDGSALTSLQLIDDTVYTDDAAFTPGTSKVLAMGAQADEDSTDSVDEGDVGALRMTLERKLRTVAALDSASMQSGNDQVTPKFAVISASSSGDNTIVSAVASKKIRVLSYYFTANGTVTVRWESGAGGTALSGQMDFIVNTGIVVPFSPVGHFETGTNTLLNLELSGAVEVAGGLTYIECD